MPPLVATEFGLKGSYVNAAKYEPFDVLMMRQTLEWLSTYV